MLGACTWRPSEITSCYPTALVLLDNDLPPACPWTETKETPALISVISLGHSAQFEFSVNMPNSSDDANSPSQPSWRSRSWAKSWLKAKVLVVQSYLTLCNTLYCVHQIPLSKEFSRKKYWSIFVKNHLNRIFNPVTARQTTDSIFCYL